MHRVGSLSSTAPANLSRRPEGLCVLPTGTASTYSRPCSVLRARYGERPRPRKGPPDENVRSERQFGGLPYRRNEESDRVGPRGRPAPCGPAPSPRPCSRRPPRHSLAAARRRAPRAASRRRRRRASAPAASMSRSRSRSTSPAAARARSSGAGAFEGQARRARGRPVEPAPEHLASAGQRPRRRSPLPDRGSATRSSTSACRISTRSFRAGKRWIRLDLLDVREARWASTSTSSSARTGRTPCRCSTCCGASGHVKEIGPDIVAGAKVTKYHGVVDLRRGGRSSGGASAAGDRAACSRTGQPCDDPGRRLDRGRRRTRPPDPRDLEHATSAGEKVTSATLTTMSRWGMHVAVVAPPAREVYHASGPASPAGSA